MPSIYVVMTYCPTLSYDDTSLQTHSELRAFGTSHLSYVRPSQEIPRWQQLSHREDTKNVNDDQLQ